MKHYKHIDAQIIPSGNIKNIEEFKEFIKEDLDQLMALKKEFEADKDTEVPLPITIYIYYEDTSAQKIRLMPNSDFEKKMLFIAVKKQIAEGTLGHIQAKPVYGGFTAEVFMGSYQITKEDKQLSSEERDKKYEEKFKNNENKYSRVLIQLQDVATKLYHVEIFSIIDSCILIPEEKESQNLVESLNDESLNQATANYSYMSSLFDYTKEQEIDIIGSNVAINIEQLNIEQAVEFIREQLKS